MEHLIDLQDVEFSIDEIIDMYMQKYLEDYLAAKDRIPADKFAETLN